MPTIPAGQRAAAASQPGKPFPSFPSFDEPSHDPGMVKLLFETPSGFAVFDFRERYLTEDVKDLWTNFTNLVRLQEFKKFEDKANAINLTTKKIDISLTRMLLKWCHPNDRLVVGRPEHKQIIEQSLELTCVYNDQAVREVMWGMQNLMHTLVPEEQSEITKEDRLPSCQGLDMVLHLHGIDVKPEMVNERIIILARALHDIGSQEEAHSKYLHRFVKHFEKLFGADIKDWRLFKLVNAVKTMCHPEYIDLPTKMFSPAEYKMIAEFAKNHQNLLDKSAITTIYEDIILLFSVKLDILAELECLVEKAKEAEEAERKPVINGFDSKQQVDNTGLTADQRTVHNQSSIDEGQHNGSTGDSLPVSNSADAIKNISLYNKDTPVNQSVPEAEVNTSSSVAPQLIPPQSSLLSITTLGHMSDIRDEDKVGDHKDTEDSAAQMNAVQNADKVNESKHAQETSAK